ncbi:L-type lectin-domain containing receptor kinase IX.1-like [Cornus florida]|uniref:L-type lectin-domain containing receptor kinase IX.1-like n=1 Tax=Cornus florida TaxID=4283 RepID=UPI0028966BA1|nr:L-type lectin-domain containing receptor kinase IX.1-like [Cornus florida]
MHLTYSVLSPYMITFFFFLLIPFASPLYFNLPNITNDNNSSIHITGDAYISEQGIQVTPDPDDYQNASSLTWKGGRATYVEPLHLWDRDTGQLADFNTHFSFLIARSSLTDSIGFGLAFFLAPNGSNIPDNALGGRLGLTNNEEANAFVAVEFDTYRDDQWEAGYPFNHVGININSSSSVTHKPWYDIFNNGTTNDAWISYDSSSQNLSVVFTLVGENSTIEKHDLGCVVDLRDILPEWVTFGFSASTSNLFEKNSIKSWEFNSTSLNIGDGKEESKTGLVVGLSVGSCVLVVVLALVGIVLWKRKSRGERREDVIVDSSIGQREDLIVDPSLEEEFGKGMGPRKFSYNELARATNYFAEAEKLGEGGFGGVYRGFLGELKSYVAVKRISKGSKQGLKEYAAEVKIIGQLRHRNLVRLIGWCHEQSELLIVYEVMQNGSLDSHLFKERSLLSWEVRYRIAQDIASALLYLHEEWEQWVVHRDIKSSNVMLDSDFNAKLGDFGLARLIDHGKGPSTTDVAGTIGYMAPEYFTTWKASKETDIYSFGIVVLEIACGRKSIDPNSDETQKVLVNWMWDLYGRGRLLEAADQKLGGDFDEQEMECLMIVGLWCAHRDPNLRPSIRQAAHVLSFESPLPVLIDPTSLALPTNIYDGTSSKSSQIKSSSYSSHSNISSKTTTTSAASNSPSASLVHRE